MSRERVRQIVMMVVLVVLAVTTFYAGLIEVDGSPAVYVVVVALLCALSFAVTYRWQRAGVMRAASRAGTPQPRKVPVWAGLLFGVAATLGIFIFQVGAGTAAQGYISVGLAAVFGMFLATFRHMPASDDGT